ncbi:Lipoma-preferred partner isoform X1 [Oopsacas minuta]|uniref:Lipoma-preferred partner isoform X1 n=1 Tax=Oopsacas minuta TaxID=111878 RepID=A0AAV7KG55_9METZ|nr:Lipoma-preferred partner isoform X1 [Oopsacas minuta]
MKLKAILKPQSASSRVPKATRTPSGKKVTWNLDEEQVQPGESNVAEVEAWPSPDTKEDAVEPVSKEHGSYVMLPGISSDEDTTPTHVSHHRQDNIYEPIIPIHTRTLNPLRAATYLPKVSHRQSSSLPSAETPNENQVLDHKRFSSLDYLEEEKLSYENHQEAPWYKKANVDWTKNRLKPGSVTKPVRFDLNSWSEKERNHSILDDLSQFLDENTDSAASNKRISFPPDDQISTIESDVSSVNTFFENEDRIVNTELLPFLYETPLQYQPYTSTLSSAYNTILPPLQHQPPRKYQENYIILPMQSYTISTVCEVTFSSQITLLLSDSLTEITFETNETPSTPTITKKESPTIYELSDRQCPPLYINTSTSLPHLNCVTKSNPRMSYRQMSQEGKNTTLPRANRSHRSRYEHFTNEESIWTKHNSVQPVEMCVTPSSGSDPYLACDKSTGQMISPNLKRVPFRRGHLEKNHPPMKSTSFSHLYTSCNHPPSRPVGSLKCSYSASCVRDEHQQNPSSYVCYTAHDATPAYIAQESQRPYMNIDIEQMNRYCMLGGDEDLNIGYRAPPRYFTPHAIGVCSECKEYIYPAPCQPVRINKRIFHPDCFKCTDCYSLLHVLSYQEVQGKFYCLRDFKRHIDCYVCKQPLAAYRGRESPVNIYDKFFHPQCYRCTSCSTQNQKLSFDGRWLLCIHCTQARRQQTIKPTQLKPRVTLVTLL